METIRIKDKEFKLFIRASQIEQEVIRIAGEINRDYLGKRPLFLSVLNGSFVFAADLLRLITVESQVCFVKLSSYSGTSSVGEVRELIGLDIDIEGRPIIVLEDIIDTGLTMAHIVKMLKARNPESIDICTLLLKPGKLRKPLDIRYCAMQIPDDFIVGYGLDYDGYGRNMGDIYTIIQQN